MLQVSVQISGTTDLYPVWNEANELFYIGWVGAYVGTGSDKSESSVGLPSARWWNEYVMNWMLIVNFYEACFMKNFTSAQELYHTMNGEKSNYT